MRHILDKELKGHAMIYGGPLEMLQSARTASKNPVGLKFNGYPPDTNYPGRKGKGWDAHVAFIGTPWPIAMKCIDMVQDAIRKENMPTPKSRKRKGFWSDIEGEVDVPRALSGEPELFRNIKRQQRVGPTNISLVTNLDSPGSCNSTGLFYRSIVCIAVADILEELGYSTEIITWCYGYAVFPAPYDRQFTVCRVKEAGNPIDKTALCDSLSAWFTLEVIFGTFPACPGINRCSYGGAILGETKPESIEKAGMKGWEKYLDITEGTMGVPIPHVAGTLEAAVNASKEVLTKIIELQESR